MPQKGGGGGDPPQTTNRNERPILTGSGRAIPGSLDRSDEDEEDDETFVYGDIVHDEEQEEPDDLVVVNVPDVRADQWEVNGGTLADQNPTCPPHDDVVIVVPLVELDEYMPDWDEREEEIPLEQLEEDGVTAYVYPGMRLDRVGDSHLRE